VIFIIHRIKIVEPLYNPAITSIYPKKEVEPNVEVVDKTIVLLELN
jgi:hypothetical protein